MSKRHVSWLPGVEESKHDRQESVIEFLSGLTDISINFLRKIRAVDESYYIGIECIS